VAPPRYTTTYEDEERVYPIPDERAIRDLKTPQGDNQTPFAYGNRVLAAGKYLNQVLSEIETNNSQTITKAENMAELQSRKTVWPKILHMVHAVIPPTDPALAKAMADGSEAYRQLVNSDPTKYKRTQRRQIFIDKLEASYSADVMATLEEMKGTASRSSAYAPAQGVALPGFAIRLTGRTPYENATQFIDETLVKGLSKVEEAGEKLEQVSIYFDGVHLDDMRPLSGGGGMTGGGGRWGTYNKGLGESDLDPITGEPMRTDWEFEVIFAAVLAERPPEPVEN
jgi:hypothetical protein